MRVGDSQGGWKVVAEDSVVRDEDTYGVAVLSVFDDDNFSREGPLDAFRAYLSYIEPDDLDRGQLVSLLDYAGYVDANSERVDWRLAKEIGCGTTLDDESLEAVRAHLGRVDLALLMNDLFGTTWDIPETYHDHDDGWNGPWTDNQDPDLRAWGSLSGGELAQWAANLGCDSLVPRVSVIDLVDEGYVGKVWTPATEGERVNPDGLAFDSEKVARMWAECKGANAPESFLTFDIGQAQQWAEDPDDAISIIEAARPKSVNLAAASKVRSL